MPLANLGNGLRAGFGQGMFAPAKRLGPPCWLNGNGETSIDRA
jgi:hypothetical protein